MIRTLRGVVLITLLLPTLLWALCATPQSDFQARVEYVYDGDTVRLYGGEKIRLVGINSPELDHEHGQHQPQAVAARRYLQQLLKDSQGQVHIVYAAERQDRYQRSLAHLYLPDGRNINELLVLQGLAFRIAIPPNLQYQTCYVEAEQLARRHGRGVWSQSDYWILDSHAVGKQHKGFRLVQGRVERMQETGKSIWLVMSGDKLRLRIARSDLNSLQLDASSLIGKQVLVRGWLHPNNYGMQLRLKHANDVMLLP